MKGKKDNILLILDLDETLIHATSEPENEDWDFSLDTYKVYTRPGLSRFLDEIKKNFQIGVWSSASDDYVAEVCKIIFPDQYPLEFVWGRSRCTQQVNYAQMEAFGYLDPYSHYQFVKKSRNCLKLILWAAK
ncbi:MAG: HAD family hydrolase, partial [Bacteroidota bacterium]